MVLILTLAAITVPALVAALLRLRNERRVNWLRQRIGA